MQRPNKLKKYAPWLIGAAIIVVALAVILPLLANNAPEPEPTFQGFMFGSEVIIHAEDMLGLEERLVRIKLGDQVPAKDFVSAIGVDNAAYAAQYTVFQATVVYDYHEKAPVEEAIYFSQTGTYAKQLEESPIMEPGKEYAVFLYRMEIGDNLYGACYGKHGTFDIVSTADGEVLYKRGVALPLTELPMTDEEKQQITSTPENPAVYSQKIAPGEMESLVDIICELRDLRQQNE